LQKVHDIFEEFHVPALIRADTNSLDILLNRRSYNLRYGSIVSKVNYFSAGRLKNTAHDIDRGVMTIEK
jgi:hypothetical protein